jgi:hypothetical protein
VSPTSDSPKSPTSDRPKGPISDRPSSPFDGYHGTDATLLVFMPRQQPWSTTLVTIALFLSGVAAFAASSELMPLFLCGLPVYGLILLVVMSMGRLVALAVERDALVLFQKRFIDSDYVTRIRFKDMARVLRNEDLARCTVLHLETHNGGSHDVPFITGFRRSKPRFELVVNKTTTEFPADPKEVGATIAALCTVLAEHGVPLEIRAAAPK